MMCIASNPDGGLKVPSVGSGVLLQEAPDTMTCMWLQVGAHDGDWEHVTMRLSADGSAVLGFYYSAHRCALWPPRYALCFKDSAESGVFHEDHSI